MKYIFKTLDDLRINDKIDDLSDITFWYLKHKIRRFTMSHTFVSLEIYRKLNGRISLIELTKNYNKGLITALIDERGKVVEIFDEFGDLWSKIKYKNLSNSSKNRISKLIKEKPPKLNIVPCDITNKPVSKMSVYELIDYYKFYDHKNDPPLKIALIENELIKRNLSSFVQIDTPHNLNDLEHIKFRLDICEVDYFKGEL